MQPKLISYLNSYIRNLSKELGDESAIHELRFIGTPNISIRWRLDLKSKLGMAQPAPTQRKQNFIDAQVQGALLKRICLH